MLTAIAIAAALAQPLPRADLDDWELPDRVVTQDDTIIEESCRIIIPPGTIIEDANGNGVIHIRKDNLIVGFADDTALVGADYENRWDQLTGIGVRVEGARRVQLLNFRVHGYKIGVLATDADQLTVEGADLSDNYRQRLGSTPDREDSSDWLYPHRNDDREWLTNHGAALAVERSRTVSILGVRVRRGQNGIVLDRVNGSSIYDNDASFLSGWGLALWRSSGNNISRNAFDFCVRGHSEGVYNRGQDSAGILFFEQSSKNTVFENSATHGGDGFFGFAGREALGETPRPDGAKWSYDRVGCNDNSFAANDFSYASAHGWEMTFSEGNFFMDNRVVGNAICGIWAGYSSDTIILMNEFRHNGGMPYGDQGGAINIEHGTRNLIYGNDFIDNTVAVRLWWDNDENLFKLPGVGDHGVRENWIWKNRIEITNQAPFEGPRHEGRAVKGLWFQDPTGEKFTDNLVIENFVEADGVAFEPFVFEPGTEPDFDFPWHDPFDTFDRLYRDLHDGISGSTRPVGARPHLQGREAIIMNEWGPWDHESPMLRLRERAAGRTVYELFGVDGPVLAAATAGEVRVEETGPYNARRITHELAEPGVHTASLAIAAPGFVRTLTDKVVNTTWHARVWAYTADPLTDADAWRAEATTDRAVAVTLDALDFNFQARGPADLGMLTRGEAASAGIGRDAFGTIATTTIPLAAGRWTVRTVSDDGIRIYADDELIIERWDIHGPTPDAATIELTNSREVTLRVEHFEKDGWAALSVTIEPAGPKTAP